MAYVQPVINLALQPTDLELLEDARATGRAIIAGACARAGVDPDEFFDAADELHRWARRERLLADLACEAFDDEAHRRGLNPADAADDLELAGPIEATAHVSRVWKLVDRAETRMREQQQRLPDSMLRAVLAEIRTALDAASPLCAEMPACFKSGIPNSARDALDAAFRWVPQQLVSEMQSRYDQWRRFDLSLPTGATSGSYLCWLASWQAGTGSGIGSIQQIYTLFGAPLPRGPRPQGIAAVVGSDPVCSVAAASYTDWPAPQINFHDQPTPALAVHELCHWLELRAQPLLARIQHAHLRRRQIGPLEPGRPAWSAQQRIPAGMIAYYQECWYSSSEAAPANFEVLSTTLSSLEQQHTSVFKDVDTLAVCLGALAISA